MPSKPPSHSAPSGLARVLERNIAALVERRRSEEKARSLDERIAEAISRFTGSMRFVYIHLVIFGLWTVVNLRLTPLPAFDPSFVILACAASVEAIFLSTFVLITQNRMAAMADQRADLDLQISLLAEHEITRIITMLTELSQRMGVEAGRDPELAELAEDVMPERILDTLQDRQASASEPE